MDKIYQEDIENIATNIKGKSKLSGKTVLVAGGAGFLGNYIVNTLLELNKELKSPCKVISVDNFITSRKTKKKIDKNKNLIEITHDIKESIKVREKIDFIVHAAGIASPVYYKKFPLEALDVAVQGTRNLLDLGLKKKIKSFLFFSSSEIYGNPPDDQIPTKETYNGNVSSIGPRSCYDESKRLGETLCMVYYSLYKSPVKIVRPFNIYGPKMNKHDYRVIPTFIQKLLIGEDLPVHESGKQTRSFCYVTDAVTGFINVLLTNRNGEVFNIGNDQEEININLLGQKISKLHGSKKRLQHIEYPKSYPGDEPQRRCPNINKYKNETGIMPHVALEEGLKRTLDWCKLYWRI